MAGILGTVAIHLIIAILFLSVKVTSNANKIKEKQIVIDFTEEDIEVMKQIEEKKKELNELLKNQANTELQQEMKKNIPVNQAQKEAEEISTEKYMDELKKDYNIDGNKKKPLDDKGDIKVEEEKPEKTDTKKKIEYAGPTTITYHLKNRHSRRIPEPIYLCERGGSVTVDIKVDRDGYVVQANINTAKSLTSDECLYSAALKSARNSRFNTDLNADYRQEGTIAYEFMAQ
jgi:Ser-tRNA(Ala) deacylase AlaX